MSKDFRHEPAASRYVLRIDGELAAVVDYRINGSAISFNRTFTTPARRGQGLAAELVEFAASDVRDSTDRHIVPMCWYVGEWFDKNPTYTDLLTRQPANDAESAPSSANPGV
ncbi:MAG: N-acetyltransferase [Glaciihabitans sp.]|nr:N-acetyltransferase [Glaciihabitans sp.]